MDHSYDPWVARGWSMGDPWVTNWPAIANSWVAHGPPKGDLWATHNGRQMCQLGIPMGDS